MFNFFLFIFSMMRLDMTIQRRLLAKSRRALITLVRPNPQVEPLVLRPGPVLREGFLAVSTGPGPLPRVDGAVRVQVFPLFESFSALVTHVRPLLGVLHPVVVVVLALGGEAGAALAALVLGQLQLGVGVDLVLLEDVQLHELLPAVRALETPERVFEFPRVGFDKVNVA